MDGAGYSRMKDSLRVGEGREIGIDFRPRVRALQGHQNKPGLERI